MATRALIVLLTPDKIHVTYCHYDGGDLLKTFLKNDQFRKETAQLESLFEHEWQSPGGKPMAYDQSSATPYTFEALDLQYQQKLRTEARQLAYELGCDYLYEAVLLNPRGHFTGGRVHWEQYERVYGDNANPWQTKEEW